MDSSRSSSTKEQKKQKERKEQREQKKAYDHYEFGGNNNGAPKVTNVVAGSVPTGWTYIRR